MTDTKQNQTQTDRVTIFLCECGPIIRDALDLDLIKATLERDCANIELKRYPTLCSEDGQLWLQKELETGQIKRFVMAGCSPGEHGHTMNAVCRRAGFNPFLMTMANIREQCSWVIEDRDKATAKAITIIKAALARNRAQLPLHEKEIDCNTDVLIIGAGVAGMTAAKLLADAGRNVVLVEQSAVIGGKVPLMNEVYPNMECASCMIEHLMDEVLHHGKIELLTCSEVTDLLGFLGNFTARITSRPRYVNLEGCYACGTCSQVCPVSVPDIEFQRGLASKKAITIPYPGALPNTALIDPEYCLALNGGDCHECVQACPFGNIELDHTETIIERQVGAVVIATGLQSPFPAFLDHQTEKLPVFDLFTFERMLHTDGPTQGKILTWTGQTPQSILMVHCLDENGASPESHCSKICCMIMAKCIREIRTRLPEATIHSLVMDRCIGGRGYREFYRAALAFPGYSESLITPETRLKWEQGPAETLRLFIDTGLQQITREADLAVVALPFRGSDSISNFARQSQLIRDAQGFFIEEHEKLKPLHTRKSGLFLAGGAQGPKDIQDTVSQAAGTAGYIMSLLVPGKKLEIEPTVASVDPERCGACKLCVQTCVYQAISFNEQDNRAEINDMLCRGCGVCAALCPSSAITAHHFSDAQIVAELESMCS